MNAYINIKGATSDSTEEIPQKIKQRERNYYKKPSLTGRNVLKRAQARFFSTTTEWQYKGVVFASEPHALKMGVKTPIAPPRIPSPPLPMSNRDTAFIQWPLAQCATFPWGFDGQYWWVMPTWVSKYHLR
ncbi:hypothetical protein [Microbulbifer sp. 2205BS26-8]|uniref:hypothetical protein n=1 Tax=Microbulbifer sp. 2205BS26-8 TaxID=3064386 RepID=UPI00273F72D1|nr:hypothetical protein [Microbulbifer sp. 2205BS26-8]MDP5210282.1 hypothetical protein [Microbulbifer sp. 2205BS26-8]